MKVRYEDVILRSFNKFDLKPRDNQLTLINDILEAYTIDDKKHVVLSAPTGTGKSIIAVIVAECMGEIQRRNRAHSYILMHTNALAEQYHETFSQYGEKFAVVMGANNYGCAVLKDTADNCIYSELKGPKKMLCDKCDFHKLRQRKATSDHFITNYSYYFVSALYNEQHVHRHLAVFDEAHLINDVFSSHLAITISMQHNKYLMSRLQKFQTMNFLHYVDILTKVSEAIKGDMVKMSNYGSLLLKMRDFYKEVSDDYWNVAQGYMDSNNLPAYTSYVKVAKLFKNLSSKISELEKQKYEHVVDIKDTAVIVSPIFVGDMFKKINTAEYHLFMSATIDDNFISTTLKIPKSEMKFIKSPSVFKPENKSVVLINHDNYNYKKLQDKGNLVKIANLVQKILDENRTKNGIILTPSFYINEFVATMIRARTNINLIEHVRGTPLTDVLKQHKRDPRNTVLISPSMFEGIDLPNDQSRFQVFVKAPYPSIGDKRIKYIFDNYMDIYETMTLYKIIQGFGRSTRNNTDYSITYALDKNISRLFHSPKNKWKDEFKLI